MLTWVTNHNDKLSTVTHIPSDPEGHWASKVLHEGVLPEYERVSDVLVPRDSYTLPSLAAY